MLFDFFLYILSLTKSYHKSILYKEESEGSMRIKNGYILKEIVGNYVAIPIGQNVIV